LFCVAGLPWYVAMWLTHGTPYLQSFFLADNLERFATTRYNDVRAIWYYVPILLGGLVPWTIFLLVLPWRPLRDVLRRRRRLTNEEWRLLIWTIVPLVLFTASVGKQPRYILPVLPPIAMMLGIGIANRVSATRNRAASRELTIATLVTAVMFASMAALLYRARVLFVSAYPAGTWTGIVLVSLAAVALAAIAVTRSWRRLPVVMAMCAAILLLTLEFGAFAGKRPEAVEEIAGMIHANRLGGEPIGEYETFVRNLPFYTHIRQVPITDDTGALTFLNSAGRVFLVLHQRDLDRLRTLSDVPLTTIGQVTYWNTAAVRLRTLLAPLPEQDLDTVVLVSNR
jgi:4-amino-4-deoxy-L-arabinose transferase-like glycosyltransferase